MLGSSILGPHNKGSFFFMWGRGGCDVLRSVNGTASKCKTFLATATEECCPAIGTLAGHFTRRLSPSPMPGKRIQQLTCHLKEAVRARNSIALAAGQNSQ